MQYLLPANRMRRTKSVLDLTSIEPPVVRHRSVDWIIRIDVNFNEILMASMLGVNFSKQRKNNFRD